MNTPAKLQGCRTLRLVLPDKSELFVCVCQFSEHQARAFFQMNALASEPAKGPA